MVLRKTKLRRTYSAVLDPSITHTGLAGWEGVLPKTCLMPDHHALFSTKQDVWEDSCSQAAALFESYMEKYRYRVVYCEAPQYMQFCHVTASSGALVKMAHLTGMYAGICGRYDCEFRYVQVVDWKGNLPKNLVIQRLVELFNRKGFEEVNKKTFRADEWDAVGIGAFVMGLF